MTITVKGKIAVSHSTQFNKNSLNRPSHLNQMTSIQNPIGASANLPLSFQSLQADSAPSASVGQSLHMVFTSKLPLSIDSLNKLALIFMFYSRSKEEKWDQVNQACVFVVL